MSATPGPLFSLELYLPNDAWSLVVGITDALDMFVHECSMLEDV